VLAALGVLAARGAPAATSPPTTVDAPLTETPPSQQAPDPDPAVDPPDPESGDGPSEPLSADVELAVLAAARPALGATGLSTTTDGPDRWALEARIAAVEVVTADYAVATVHGLVIEHTDGAWHGPGPAAVGVLLRRSPTLAVVGGAWPLPTPPLSTTSVDVRPVEDPDASVVASIQDAGWSVTEVTAVETSEDALLRISLRGTAPGAGEPTDHVLWLLDAPGGPRLLPLAAPTTTEDLP
jgi:hypothetical protein